MKTGFTLVELTICLLIMALLIAGIAAGRSMVDDARKQKHKLGQQTNNNCGCNCNN